MAVNLASVELLEQLRAEWETPETPCVISGAIGPRGDGYKAGRMDAGEAEAYHAAQIAAFADSEADMVAAYTMNTIDEAVGIARAARRSRHACAISFTVETNGALATGDTLRKAVETVDAETGGSPLYYMINCAHPTHFAGRWRPASRGSARIRGIRANASAKSHQELDESEVLDAGDPVDLGSATAR